MTCHCLNETPLEYAMADKDIGATTLSGWPLPLSSVGSFQLPETQVVVGDANPTDEPSGTLNCDPVPSPGRSHAGKENESHERLVSKGADRKMMPDGRPSQHCRTTSKRNASRSQAKHKSLPCAHESNCKQPPRPRRSKLCFPCISCLPRSMTANYGV